MKRESNSDFKEIEILKEKYLERITVKENEIRSTFTEFRDNITGAVLINKLKDNLFGGPGLAFRLGFMAVSMLRQKLKNRAKNKS